MKCENKILHGDCLEHFKNIEDNSIDFVLIDPPYELDTHGGTKNVNLKRKIHDKHIDFVSGGFDMESVFNEIERAMKVTNICIFCSNKQLSKTMKFWEDKNYSVTCLLWKKKNPIPFGNGKYLSDVEFIVYARGKNAPFNNLSVKEKSKVFEYSSPKKRIHDTEKPVKLLEKLIIIHSNENDVVLDCFGGSGSTAEACLKTNRCFIIIEILEYYYNEIVKRVNDFKN